jgi:MRG-binding protein
MAVKRRTTESSNQPPAVVNLWTIENELKLFRASLKFKPAGIIKHFNMALIHNELVKNGMRDVTTAAIWEHLEQLYNLEVANQIENSVPYLDETAGSEFKLPKKEFQAAMNEMKKGDTESADTKESEASSSSSNSKKANTSVPVTLAPETPKTTGIKRPTRSTPGSGTPSVKRRK